jgi:carbamoyltransferase
MSSNPVSIGLNIGHDGGCAILDGERIIAIAEERLNRTRYSSGWHTALAYCLEASDVRLSEVDAVVFSSTGPRLPDGFTGGLDRYGVDPSRIHVLDHHLSHAYSAFCMSGFDDALVVVADGAGNDRDTESYYLADRSGLEKVGGNRPDRARAGGIGATYEAFTNYIGFHEQEAGKTMALASFGDPDAYRIPLFDLNVVTQVEGVLSETHERGLADYAAARGLDIGPPHMIDDQRSMDLASWVQRETEDILVRIVDHLFSRHGRRRVCFAGGVAMNCVANSALRHRTGADLFVVPPASDRGQALGNALHGMHLLTGSVPRHRLENDSFGRTYTAEEVLLALRRHPRSMIAERHPRHRFTYERVDDPATVAAELIADGKIIGWFQGGSELGARALGHRSILTDPRSAEARDILNSRIKHREWFRPFAPAVLTECASEWFEIDHESPFMLFAPHARPQRRSQLAGVTHTDGTARVQTVRADHDPDFHRLISRVGALTGVPVVLNTSFNDREPIVESPAHAVATFTASDLDALVMGEYLVVKE